MRSEDVNKCDSASGKINPTALLSVSFGFRWRAHSSHAPCCRLAGMQIVVGRRLWFPVFGNVFSRGASGKKGAPERKRRSRWAWPLLSQIGRTPSDRRGRAAREAMAAAHRLSFCRPNEKPLCQQAAPPHCCQQNGSGERWDGGAELFGMTKRPSHKHWSGWILTKSNLDNSIVGITEGGKASFDWCSHIDHLDPSASNLCFRATVFYPSCSYCHLLAVRLLWKQRSQPTAVFWWPGTNVCLFSKKVVNGALTISRQFKYLYSKRAFSSSLNHPPRLSASASTNLSLVIVREY